MVKFKLIDIAGKKFNRLTVIRLFTTGVRTKWLCMCDCGTECIKDAYALKKGLVISCGCYRREETTKRKTLHGLARHPLFYVLQKMKDRCNNPKSTAYKNYGGRGICVCKEWNEVEVFIEWALLNGYAPGLEIDRVDSIKGNIKEFMIKALALNSDSIYDYQELAEQEKETKTTLTNG